MNITLICYLVATILAALAAFGVNGPRFNTGWGSLAFLALGMTLGGVGLR